MVDDKRSDEQRAREFLMGDLRFYSPPNERNAHMRDVEALERLIQTVRAERDAELALDRAALPDDLRAAGWTVAVHNDYRLDGKPMTFWLLTRGDHCVKGEGASDAEALGEIRKDIARRYPPIASIANVDAMLREAANPHPPTVETKACQECGGTTFGATCDDWCPACCKGRIPTGGAEGGR